LNPWRRRTERARDDDPCLCLAVALRNLQSTYGPPRTRAQINAWNEAERALDALREEINAGKDAHHTTPNQK
jgi:hypothetical protein